jgi:hypothetical protein
MCQTILSALYILPHVNFLTLKVLQSLYRLFQNPESSEAKRHFLTCLEAKLNLNGDRLFYSFYAIYCHCSYLSWHKY